MVNVCLCTCTVAVSVNALMLQSRATVLKVPFVVHVATAVHTPAGSDATVRRTVPTVEMKRTVMAIHITNAGFALTETVSAQAIVAMAMLSATTIQMRTIVILIAVVN